MFFQLQIICKVLFGCLFFRAVCCLNLCDREIFISYVCEHFVKKPHGREDKCISNLFRVQGVLDPSLTDVIFFYLYFPFLFMLVYKVIANFGWKQLSTQYLGASCPGFFLPSTDLQIVKPSISKKNILFQGSRGVQHFQGRSVQLFQPGWGSN